MRAALYRSHGPADDVLEVTDVAPPEPGPGEVRVRVAVSAVNPTDVKNRSGLTNWAIDGFQVPHQDGAGVIDAVGEGVPASRVGERVWLMLAAHGTRWGTAAEHCVVPAWKARPLPDSASFALGATLGVPAVTAAYCLLDDGPIDGRDVLVAGGAGGVGRAAIQIGRHVGARVVTTVSTDEKEAVARAAGVEHVVRYREADAAERIRAICPAGVTRIVELSLAVNVGLDLAVAAPRATVIVYANDGGDPTIPVRPSMYAGLTYRFMMLYQVVRADLERAADVVDDALRAGALDLPPATTYALDDIAAAHAAQEAGPFGRVLVQVADLG